MYTCGPTVYDYAHIGNFRAYIFEDLLRRYLKYKGYSVLHVMNVTDIDDKTINGASEAGVSLNEYTQKYIEAFFEDLDALKIERAEHYPRATEHIKEMIDLIQVLLDKGIAYESDGAIYYKIEKFSAYGKLSKKDIDKNIIGARVDHDEYERDDARDFVLWKKHKDGEPSWEAPFGKGRPGWHIECSAMSMKYLGETFDIHTGGEDNIFPHHENEIAQSEGATGKQFVKYWLHCKFLLVNNEKMAKSKGNFYTLRGLLDKDYSPMAIRYLLLSHNYRQPLNFTLEGIEQAQASINRIRDFIQRVKECRLSDIGYGCCSVPIRDARKAFEDALNDDLNIAQAIVPILGLISFVNREIEAQTISQVDKEELLSFFDAIDSVLGILPDTDDTVPTEIQTLADERQKARKKKDFAKADEIREKIDSLGWVIEDTPQGARIKKK